MIHLLPLALAKAKWKIPGFETESSSDSIVAERNVCALISACAEWLHFALHKGIAVDFPMAIRFSKGALSYDF